MQYENKHSVEILFRQELVLEVHLFQPFANGAKWCELDIALQISEESTVSRSEIYNLLIIWGTWFLPSFSLRKPEQSGMFFHGGLSGSTYKTAISGEPGPNPTSSPISHLYIKECRIKEVIYVLFSRNSGKDVLMGKNAVMVSKP